MSPLLRNLLKAALLLAVGAACGAGGGIAAWRKMNPPPKPRPVMLGSGPGSLAPPELPPEPDPEPVDPGPADPEPPDPAPADPPQPPPVDPTPPPDPVPPAADPGPEFFGFPVGSTARAPEPPPKPPPPVDPAPAVLPKPPPPKPAPKPPPTLRARFMKDRCVAGFDGVSTLHEFSGWTKAVSGEVSWEKGNLAKTARATVTVDARTLDTGDADRDKAMHHEHLESEKFPTMSFEIASVTLTGDESMTMAGSLEIHGKRRDVEIPCTLKVRRDGYVYVKGEVKAKMTDFGIEPPSKMGMIKVDDEIRIWFQVWAEPVKPEEKPR